MFKKLVPFKDCINEDLYEMYQDIPKQEIGSINKLYQVSYEEFKIICQMIIQEESKTNIDLNTTTKRFILYVDSIPIGEVGIRTTLNDFWINHGSQIFYKIRKSKRGMGYGNDILKMGLEKAKEMGFTKIRINCDNNNLASKKIILNNKGKIDIKNYKTSEGISTSYIIEL